MRDDLLDLINEAIDAHEECRSKVSQIMDTVSELDDEQYKKLKDSIESKASQFVNFNTMLEDIMGQIEDLEEEEEDEE